jgi:micrococcal nuclease
MMQRVIAIILLISVFNTSCNSGSGKRNADKTDVSLTAQDGFLLVTKVVDGDTFWADDGTSKGLKIRLIGVDAPESRKTFKKKLAILEKKPKHI